MVTYDDDSEKSEVLETSHIESLLGTLYERKDTLLSFFAGDFFKFEVSDDEDLKDMLEDEMDFLEKYINLLESRLAYTSTVTYYNVDDEDDDGYDDKGWFGEVDWSDDDEEDDDYE